MNEPGKSPEEVSFADRVAEDVGGAFTVGMAYIGDRLGLFAAVAALGSATSEIIAERTGLQERYVREWANGMVASRYLEYDPARKTYFFTAEQEAALAREDSRTFVAGAFQLALPSLLLTPRLMDVFRAGGGIAFSDLPVEIPAAIERMHRPWFQHLLVQEWLPAVVGLVDGLRRGMSVLDVGCGEGRSTLAMARAFPSSTFVGIDPHGASIAKAVARGADLGVSNVRFLSQSVEEMLARGGEGGKGGKNGEGAKSGSQAQGPYDLIVAIDCIHDMAAPVAALKAIRRLLRREGVVFWSEPSGSHEPLENRNPQGKIRANLSSFHCLTVSLAEGGDGLGTIIGEAGARTLARQAAFAVFEKVPIESSTQQFFVLRGGLCP